MRLGSVFKMRMSILNTATTEQMGYGIFSFFVYIKSTSQYYIVCKRSKISFSIYFGGFFSSSSHESHVFNEKPRSLATSSGERLVFILASLIVIKIRFSYKKWYLKILYVGVVDLSNEKRIRSYLV